MPPHVIARAVLDRGSAADRLRNHLRRRAITRIGLIEGDLYLLPFWRAAGHGPQGETGFHLLAAELGDPRLQRPNLPPADLKPFGAESVPAEARLVEASLAEAVIRDRAAGIGWHVDSLEELIHYPFWLMRVEDSGRTEGAWIDGVEGRVIHHTLKLPAPIPTLRRSAIHLALPAILMAVAAGVMDSYALVAGASVAIAAAAAAALAASMEHESRRERKG